MRSTSIVALATLLAAVMVAAAVAAPASGGPVRLDGAAAAPKSMHSATIVDQIPEHPNGFAADDSDAEDAAPAFDAPAADEAASQAAGAATDSANADVAVSPAPKDKPATAGEAPKAADSQSSGESIDDVFDGTDKNTKEAPVDKAVDEVDKDENKNDPGVMDEGKPKTKTPEPKAKAPEAKPAKAAEPKAAEPKQAKAPEAKQPKAHAAPKADMFKETSTNHPKAGPRVIGQGDGTTIVEEANMDDPQYDQQGTGAIDMDGNTVSQAELTKRNTVKAYTPKPRVVRVHHADPTRGTPENPIVWNQPIVEPPRGKQGDYKPHVTSEAPASLTGMIMPPTTAQYMDGVGDADLDKTRSMDPPTATDANNAAEKQWEEWKAQELVVKNTHKLKLPTHLPPPMDSPTDVPPMPVIKVTDTEETIKQREEEAKAKESVKEQSYITTPPANPDSTPPASEGSSINAPPAMDDVPPVARLDGDESDDSADLAESPTQAGAEAPEAGAQADLSEVDDGVIARGVDQDERSAFDSLYDAPQGADASDDSVSQYLRGM